MDNQRDKRLEEIRNNLDNVTEGTWGCDGFGTIVINETGRFIASVYDSDDAEFVAKAPEAVRCLLEEIERMQQEIRSHGPEGRNYTNQQYVALLSEVSQLREERDTLKEALSAVIEQDRKDSDAAGKTIQELTEEARRWLRERNDLVAERDRLQNDLDAAEVREANMKAELQFYADPATYDIDHLDKHGYIIIDQDGGAKARTALGIGEEEDNG